jgi:hypothetical protein
MPEVEPKDKCDNEDCQLVFASHVPNGMGMISMSFGMPQ